MKFDTTLTRDELERIIDAIAPAWRLHGATPAEGGHHAVYRLVIETPDGYRTSYLKATPEGKDPSVNLEARLLAVLDSHTTIPVPSVYDVVDEHPDLPAPFVLLEALPGEVLSRTELNAISDTALRQIARDTGRYLAELHALKAVDAFGYLTYDGPPLHGEPPSDDLDTIAVVDPMTDWRERLHDWFSETLEDLCDTRFADVARVAEPIVEARIDDLEGPFEPALARIDQALENALLRDGELRAMIDWEFTIASTPADDVVNVTWSLAGGPYLFAPGTADRRDLVSEGIVEGYRERGPERVVQRVHANRDCYELLSALRSMVHLGDWFEQFEFGEHIDDAASRLRSEVFTLLSEPR